MCGGVCAGRARVNMYITNIRTFFTATCLSFGLNSVNGNLPRVSVKHKNKIDGCATMQLHMYMHTCMCMRVQTVQLLQLSSNLDHPVSIQQKAEPHVHNHTVHMKMPSIDNYM